MQKQTQSEGLLPLQCSALVSLATGRISAPPTEDRSRGFPSAAFPCVSAAAGECQGPTTDESINNKWRRQQQAEAWAPCRRPDPAAGSSSGQRRRGAGLPPDGLPPLRQ